MAKPTRANTNRTTALVLFILLAAAKPAFPGPAPLTFEVASVKSSASHDAGMRGGCRGIDSKRNNGDGADTPLGRCVITDGRLSHLIAMAYGLAGVGFIRNAPDWVISGSERFTIEARAEDPERATEQQLLQMLQALLENRFKLKYHREQRETSGFALLAAKGGWKLVSAADPAAAMSVHSQRKANPVSFDLRSCPMATLANILSTFGPGPVVDRTGLDGSYDIKLSWNDTAGPSLVTALKEQLGLRLEPAKVPTSIFVIESAERPVGN